MVNQRPCGFLQSREGLSSQDTNNAERRRNDYNYLLISNAKTKHSKSSGNITNYIILNLVFSTQPRVLQGHFLDFLSFPPNQLNYSLPKSSGQMTAYSLRRLLYNWTGETAQSFPWNIFLFPILITEGLVSVTRVIIICLSSRFLNKDGNCIQKLLFHT